MADENRAWALTALRNGAVGFLVGLGYTCYTEYGARSSKLNNAFSKPLFELSQIKLEGMDNMPEMCQIWLQLYKMYGTVDKDVINAGLKAADNLAFLYRVMPEELKTLVENVRKKKKTIDSAAIDRYSRLAWELCSEVEEQLDQLFLLVRASEKALWTTKDQAQRQWDSDRDAWRVKHQRWKAECRRIEDEFHANESNEDFSLSSLMTAEPSQSNEWKKQCPPEPREPPEPNVLHLKLQSEVVHDISEQIMTRCVDIRRFVEKSIQKLSSSNSDVIIHRTTQKK